MATARNVTNLRTFQYLRSSAAVQQLAKSRTAGTEPGFIVNDSSTGH